MNVPFRIAPARPMLHRRFSSGGWFRWLDSRAGQGARSARVALARFVDLLRVIQLDVFA